MANISIRELSEKWKSFNVIEESGEVMSDTSEDIILLNQQQLIHGTGIDGELLPPYSRYFIIEENRTYAEKKSERNPLSPGVYDMNLSGDSFNNMRLIIEGRSYNIETSGMAQQYHNEDVNAHLGKITQGRILGLSEENIKVYRNSVFLPKFVEVLKTKTGSQ